MRNSLLVGGSAARLEEVVRWHGAMQAQDYGQTKWSIGQRAGKLVDEDVDRALAVGAIVRTHVLRPTWHVVASDDVRWMLALTGPRVRAHNARRYEELGLDRRTLARSETVLADALRGGSRLTRSEAAGTLGHAGIDPAGQRLPYILMHCELEAVICSGGLAGKQHTYALLDERVPGGSRLDRDEATVELARRYMAGHGPATPKDLSWWSSLTVADVRKALHLLGSEVRSETIEGLTFWSPAGEQGSGNTRGARLLQAFDELLVGYTESRFFGDLLGPDARAARRDRSLPTGVILLNGRVAGHWRRTIGPALVTVEAVTYGDLGPSGVRALQAEATRMGRFLGRSAKVRTNPIPRSEIAGR